MSGKKLLVLCAMFSLVLSLGIALAADIDSNQAQTQMPVAPALEPTATPAAEPDLQWLWGEVKSVDASQQELTVNYLDYESDNEKEVKVLTDEKTNFENIKALADIKVKDTVSVDYVLTPDNKYLAKLVSVEKPEEMIKEMPTAAPAVSESAVTPAAGQ